MNKTIVFRADASAKIGGGHIIRSLVLADAFFDAGWTSGFAFRPETLDVVPVLESSKHELLKLNCPLAEEPKQMRNFWPGGCNILVVDI